MKHWLEINGYFSEHEGIELQKRAAGKLCIELGSYMGRSTLCLAEVAMHVWAIDSHFKPEFQENIVGYSISFYEMLSADAHKIFDSECIDLIFEDTSHEYEIVKEDIINWWSKLKSDGIMCFHDYGAPGWPGVKQAVDEFFSPVNVEGDLVGSLVFIYKNEKNLQDLDFNG